MEITLFLTLFSPMHCSTDITSKLKRQSPNDQSGSLPRTKNSSYSKFCCFFFFSAEVKQGNSLLQTSSLDLDSVHITKFTSIKLCLVNKRTPPRVFSHELVCNQPSVLVSTHMLPKGSVLNPFSVFSHELVCHLFSYQLHDQREVFNSKTKAQTLAIVCVRIVSYPLVSQSIQLLEIIPVHCRQGLCGLSSFPIILSFDFNRDRSRSNYPLVYVQSSQNGVCYLVSRYVMCRVSSVANQTRSLGSKPSIQIPEGIVRIKGVLYSLLVSYGLLSS